VEEAEENREDTHSSTADALALSSGGISLAEREK